MERKGKAMTERMSDEKWQRIKASIKIKRMYTGDLLDMEVEIVRAREAEKSLEKRLNHFLENYHPQDTDAKVGKLEDENAEFVKNNAELGLSNLELLEKNTELKQQVEKYENDKGQLKELFKEISANNTILCDELLELRESVVECSIVYEKLKAENARLKDYEKTIIYAPGEARDIAIQRFRESDLAQDIIDCWKKENAELKEQIVKLSKYAVDQVLEVDNLKQELRRYNVSGK